MKDDFEEAPDVITRTVWALENGARHRMPLLWTLSGATYPVKIPPREQRLGTLLSETIHPNNPKQNNGNIRRKQSQESD